MRSRLGCAPPRDSSGFGLAQPGGVPWALLVAFIATIVRAGVYFLETAGYVDIIAPLPGIDHEYSKLLLISCAALLTVGVAFLLGLRPRCARP